MRLEQIQANVTDLEQKYSEILTRMNNYENLGINDLHNLYMELDAILTDAKQDANALVSGFNRSADGRLIANDNIELDLGTLSTISSSLDSLTDRLYSDISRISAIEQNKRDQFMEYGRQEIMLNHNMRLNNYRMAELEDEIDEIRYHLHRPNITAEQQADLDSRGIVFQPSPLQINVERQAELEDELAVKEKALNRYKEANAVYEQDKANLRKEAKKLIDGSVTELTENMEVNDPTLELTKAEPAIPIQENVAEEEPITSSSTLEPEFTFDPNAVAQENNTPIEEEQPVVPTLVTLPENEETQHLDNADEMIQKLSEMNKFSFIENSSNEYAQRMFLWGLVSIYNRSNYANFNDEEKQRVAEAIAAIGGITKGEYFDITGLDPAVVGNDNKTPEQQAADGDIIVGVNVMDDLLDPTKELAPNRDTIVLWLDSNKQKTTQQQENDLDPIVVGKGFSNPSDNVKRQATSNRFVEKFEKWKEKAFHASKDGKKGKALLLTIVAGIVGFVAGTVIHVQDDQIADLGEISYTDDEVPTITEEEENEEENEVGDESKDEEERDEHNFDGGGPSPSEPIGDPEPDYPNIPAPENPTPIEPVIPVDPPTPDRPTPEPPQEDLTANLNPGYGEVYVSPEGKIIEPQGSEIEEVPVAQQTKEGAEAVEEANNALENSGLLDEAEAQWEAAQQESVQPSPIDNAMAAIDSIVTEEIPVLEAPVEVTNAGPAL